MYLFNGSKTYLCAALLAAIVALQYLGLMEPQVAEQFAMLLGAGGLAALRHGVEKTESSRSV